MPKRRRTVWAGLLSLLLALPTTFLALAPHGASSPVSTSGQLPRTHPARDASLQPLPARLAEPSSATQTCSSCHDTEAGFVQDKDHFLNERALLDQTAWADSIQLTAKCGSCHRLVDADQLPTDRWEDTLINFMSKVVYHLEQAPTFQPTPTGRSYSEWMDQTHNQWMDVLHYYLVFSEPETKLPPDPPVTGVRFEPTAVGVGLGPHVHHQIGNVNIVDLDQNGEPDVVVSDFNRHRVTWIRREDDEWKERPLGRVAYPGRTAVGDFTGDGRPDIVVADVGSNNATDDNVGGVVLLINEGPMAFSTRTLLDDVGRVSDVRPGDVDQDGDIDFIVGVFGFLKKGQIGWLERREDESFTYHRVSSKTGTVNVSPIDFDGDGRLDFVALISQTHEEISVFLNEGDGRFKERVLYKADSPTYGSSGIELVDLDEDGDTDILYTNGDAFDLSTPMIRPYHGVQWLENEGGFQFTFHDLIRFYGAYRAVPGDMDGDGDLDVVVTSLLNDWADPTRKSLLWLENDGSEQFTPHGVAAAPTSLISADVADMNGDGRLDIVTGSMHNRYTAGEKRSRVTLWTNRGPVQQLPD